MGAVVTVGLLPRARVWQAGAGSIRRTWRVLAAGLPLVALALAVPSCADRAAPGASNGPDETRAIVRREFGAGPVTFEITLSSDRITTAETLTCTMTLHVNDGFDAEFPELVLPADLPGMVLTDYDERIDEEGGKYVGVREYELEPEFPGTFEIPGFEVYYHREEEIREEVFDTEPIAFTVTQTPATEDLLALRPTRGLVTVEEMERQRRRVWPWVAAAVAGAGLLATLVVYAVRRPRAAPQAAPAHETALAALRELERRDLPGRGRVDEFFVQITSIVRVYIEEAFGVRAPEQTTEEFLADMASSPRLSPYRDVLGPFLSAADEVKFARFTPDAESIARAFDTARDFVIRTSGTEA